MALSTEFLPYIFGGSTGETLESIARKRQVAEALLARGGTPKNVGEGLTAVGNALASVILERRAAAGEKAGQAGAGADFSSLTALRKSLGLPDEGGGDVTGTTPSAVPGVAPPTPAWSPRNPPPATENVPAGWGAGGSFAPPAGAPPVPSTSMGGVQAFAPPAGVPAAQPTSMGAAPASTGATVAQPTSYGGLGRGGEGLYQPFASALDKAFADAAAATGQTGRINEGLRDSKTQAQYYANYTGKPVVWQGVTYTPQKHGGLAAPPGRSLHQQGRAADIVSGPVLDWLHKNIGKYPELQFLPGNAGRVDPVHIQYAGARGPVSVPAGGVARVAQALPPRPVVRPTQVASLDPSVGLPPLPPGPPPGTMPPVAPGLSPGVAMVASALQGGGGAPAGPEMASAAPFPMGGASGLAPPFVPPSVPTGIQSGRPTPMMPTQALSPSAPPPRPAAPVQRPPQMAPAVSDQEAQAALKVLGNSFSNAGHKLYAQDVLKRWAQQQDPAYQLEQKTKEAQYQNLVNPKPTYGFQTVNGSLVRTDPRGGTADTLIKGEPEWRDATPDEIEALRLPANAPLQINTRTGQKQILSGGSGILGGGAIDPEIVGNIADGVMSGNIPPDMKSYYKYLVPVTAELQARNVNLSQLRSDWTATQRHYQTLENPQQTRIRQNIETVQHTFPVIRKLAEEWRAGGYPLLNEATRKAALQGLLGPDANRIVTLLGAQVADVTSEMSSILMGGNSPTDHAMELAGKNLSEDWSYPTFIAALDQLEQNVKFRANAIRDVSTVGTSTGLYDYTKPPPATPAPAVPPPSPPSAGPYFGPPASAAPTAPAATSPPPGGGPIRIQNDDDYAKLPSGTKFIGPDGHERVKP